MTGLSRYYLSRALISIAWGIVIALGGFAWWIAALAAAIVFAFFVWAARSGRYVVHPDLGTTALRRDERTQAINDKSARTAFVVTMLAVAAIAIYFGSIAHTAVPVAMLELTLILGAAIYFLSDFWLRRE
jgi:uncharacterized membrane protein